MKTTILKNIVIALLCFPGAGAAQAQVFTADSIAYDRNGVHYTIRKGQVFAYSVKKGHWKTRRFGQLTADSLCFSQDRRRFGSEARSSVIGLRSTDAVKFDNAGVSLQVLGASALVFSVGALVAVSYVYIFSGDGRDRLFLIPAAIASGGLFFTLTGSHMRGRVEKMQFDSPNGF